MGREPLNWRPCKEGFEAHIPGAMRFERDARPAGPAFLIEAQLFRTFSESAKEYTDEPWLGWTVMDPDGFRLHTYRRDWRFEDDYEWPVFSLIAAMAAAELWRYEQEFKSKNHGLVYNLLAARLAYRWFLRWWRRAVPSTERDKRWEERVDAEAKKRLEAEGAEPEVVTDY